MKLRSHTKGEMRFPRAERSLKCGSLHGGHAGIPPQEPGGLSATQIDRGDPRYGSGAAKPLQKADFPSPFRAAFDLSFAPPPSPPAEAQTLQFWIPFVSCCYCRNQAQMHWVANKTLNPCFPNFKPCRQTGITSRTTPQEGLRFTAEYASADHVHELNAQSSVDVSMHRSCKIAITDHGIFSSFHASF